MAMFSFKTVLVFSAIFVACYGQQVGGYYKKKHHHHHHGMHHLHFLSYLTFLAIKLKIVFFLGTIFTISLVAGKVIGIIKLVEYMKKKDDHHHHEEKIVYVNPHDHHDIEYSGHGGPWASGSEVYPAKSYGGYAQEYSGDHPPDGSYDLHERYGAAPAPYPSGRSSKNGYTAILQDGFTLLNNRLRQLNITDMALNEMGIRDENCKKKFVCKADFNSQRNVILRAGLDIVRDASYRSYIPENTVTTEEECDELYPECNGASG